MLNHLCHSGVLGPNFKSGVERFEVLPVNWRTTLTLNHETVGDITPAGLDMVRGVLNNVALDVLYFTSPRYSQEIIDTVTDKMNAVYNEFVRRNPDFLRRRGIVSLYSHSLGGVISYEILLNQAGAVDLADDEQELRAEAAKINQLQAELDSIRARQRRRELSRQQQKERAKCKGDTAGEDPTQDVEDTEMPKKARRNSLNSLDPPSSKALRTSSLTLELAEVDDLPADEELGDVFAAKTLHAQPIVYSKLKFRVAHLFAAGSPIAIFLTLRGASSQPDAGCHGAEALLPRGTRVFNCYHSVDPLAYRMEPLLVGAEKLQLPVSVDAWPPPKPLMDTAYAIGRFFSRLGSTKKKPAAAAAAAAQDDEGAAETAAWTKQARANLEERAPKGMKLDMEKKTGGNHARNSEARFQG
jgi:hypothetical protein